MIAENERDKRTAAWLIENFGAEAVAEAETRLTGARKPYPSNIAKVLGATLPESLKRTESTAARQKLASMKAILATKGKIMTAIRKFDPLIHEFENDRAEEKYTRWLTEKVEGVLSGNSQPVPHEDVAARATRRRAELLAGLKNAG